MLKIDLLACLLAWLVTVSRPAVANASWSVSETLQAILQLISLLTRTFASLWVQAGSYGLLSTSLAPLHSHWV